MFYGIAAMPSLHVAAVVLFARFLARLSILAGIVGALYAVAIAVGLVLLQWHYAVDGYAGILLAVCTSGAALPLPVTIPLRRR
jgi:membrane-associated phospholipid phosphatase